VNTRCVLVVEDSPPCRRILEIHLANAGYAVTTAVNAKEAIEILSQKKFCAMICDLVLPIGTGIDVIKALRRLQPTVFVIAVTGMISENVRLHALGEGFDRFVFKPYRASELMEMLPG
jgi:DNA-binding response OmpR family regulator